MGKSRPTLMWELARIALERPCPECGAPAGDRCRSLKDPEWRSPRTEVSMPHPPRYPAGTRRIGDPANTTALRERGFRP